MQQQQQQPTVAAAARRQVPIAVHAWMHAAAVEAAERFSGVLLLAAAAAGSCRKILSGKYPGNFCMKIPI
jgi:hypothetical protein